MVCLRRRTSGKDARNGINWKVYSPSSVLVWVTSTVSQSSGFVPSVSVLSGDRAEHICVVKVVTTGRMVVTLSENVLEVLVLAIDV